MTKKGIQNPKLIVTNNYQQYLAHFEWFKSLFHISDVKHEFLKFKLKVRKNGIFWAKNLIFENFPRLFLSLNSSYVKSLGQNWFLKGRALRAPPAIWDAFQRLSLVGLKPI